MKQYQDLIKHVLKNGTEKGDRTGTGTISVFGYQTRFDLSQGFPLVTLKKTHFKSIAHELLWFLQGSTNTKYLKANGVSIWDEWADKEGNLGPVYGKQWRRWEATKSVQQVDDRKILVRYEYDQIKLAIDTLRKNPDSRRIIVSAWNVADIDDMALPPCHAFFQFYVANNKLSCQIYQRSSDCGLGVPFNWASYALLTHMMAHCASLEVGELIWTSGDTHIYSNHIASLKEVTKRKPLPLPTLKLDPNIRDIDSFRFEHITLENYQHHDPIKLDVAV